MTFEPSQVLSTQMQFVTTDQFQLKSGTVPKFLSQDPSGDLILQEARSIQVNQRARIKLCTSQRSGRPKN